MSQKHLTLLLSCKKILLLSMLLIHLVLQLLFISVNLTICTLAYAHEHIIIHDPAARRRVHRVPARRAYARKCSSRGAARGHGILHARAARRRNEILAESSMPAQSSDQARERKVRRVTRGS